MLYQSQYGFCRHSIQVAIIDIVNTVQSNMDKRLLSGGVFLDLKKAFDSVNHVILFDKLNHYGFSGIHDKQMVLILFARPDTNITSWSTCL